MLYRNDFVFVHSSVILDSELSSIEKIFITAFFLFAFRKENLTTSNLAEIVGKNRDHVRRQINKMIKSESVRKYVEIKAIKRLNQDSLFDVTFSEDILPHSVKVTNRIKNNSLDVPADYAVFLIDYLKNSKYFKSVHVSELYKICTSEIEMLRALIYVDAKKDILKPLSYLASGFKDEKFKYKKFINTEADIKRKPKISDGYKYQISKENFSWLKESYPNLRFIYTERKINDQIHFIILTNILRTTKNLNIYNLLQRHQIQFTMYK